MSDIVEQLREWRMWPDTMMTSGRDIYELTQEAANEIEQLRVALAALLPLIPPYGYGVPEREAQRQAINAARDALKEMK